MTPSRRAHAWCWTVVVAVVAGCGGSVEPTDDTSDGAAGSGGGETAGSGAGASASGSGSSTEGAGSTATGAPVGCLDGVPAGTPCAEEGERCDNPGTSCWVACTDGIWVEDCTDCPSETPVDASDCGDFYQVGPCDYDVTCSDGTAGEASATCDGPTLTWIVTSDCSG